MSLSKFPSSIYNQNINWRLVLGVGTPVALCCFAGIYWKYNHNKKGTQQEGGEKAEENDQQEEKAKSLKDLGNKLFKLGKYDLALQHYTNAINILEEEQRQQQEGEGAVDSGGSTGSGGKFIKQEQLEQLYQNRAAVHEKLGAWSSVIRETTLALKLNGKYVKALHRRSKAYKLTGFLDEALEDITAVCILEGFQSAASVQLADDILREVGAQEGLRLMKERKPTLPSLHSVNSYLRGFWNCPIARHQNNTTESSQPPPSKTYKKALSNLKTGEYDKVLSDCSSEIEEKGSNEMDAYHLRGTLRFLYGYTDETLADLNHVIENNSSSKELKATALIKRASYFALIDDEKNCEESFAKAENIFPDNVDLWHHRGQVLLTRSNLETALEYMSRAVAIEPEYGIAVATKWYVQYRLAGFVGDIDGQALAAREFQKLLKRFPNSPDVFSLYGQILMEQQLFEEAEIHFSKVLDLDPKNASVVVHKAMSRFQRTMNPEEAIEMLKDALKIDERNEFIYETLGTLHLQIGNLEGASEYITKALGLARSFQELTILSSLKKAAEVQQKVKEKLNISAPSFYNK